MKNRKAGYWYLFYKGQVLLKEENGVKSVFFGEEAPTNIEDKYIHRVTLNSGETVYTYEIDVEEQFPQSCCLVGLRECFLLLGEHHYKAAGKAAQILHWNRHTQYCGCCGSVTEKVGDIMKRCPKCHNEIFPPIYTAIIVLIRKGDKILLVKSNNFKHDFYGLVAGFVETGENLEECVKREVMEEVGLEIDHITYFDSQSWPFPSGLMVGFVADYVSGEIKVQEDELKCADFFDKYHLPNLPSAPSIARSMIEWWRNL